MADDVVLLHAAGSLREALTEIARDFEASGYGRVQARFGPSGLLKDEIAGGVAAEVFASANMEHPRALAEAELAGPVVLFARNRLCALVRPDLAVAPQSLLDRMPDPQVRLGTSTPKADPSGDYAWEVFRKAGEIRPGSRAVLEGKALQLTGGPSPASGTHGSSIYGELVAQGAVDIFLTYCTNAHAARRENPSQRIVQLPDVLAVGAEYGLTVINTASSPARDFALFVLSECGQRTLVKHGFVAPTLPS